MSYGTPEENQLCVEAEHQELEPAYTGRNGALDVVAGAEQILAFEGIASADNPLSRRLHRINTLHASHERFEWLAGWAKKAGELTMQVLASAGGASMAGMTPPPPATFNQDKKEGELY